MQINNFVYVMHPEDGGVCLAPGEVPEWAESLITNKSVIVREAPDLPKLELSKPAEKPADDDPGTAIKTAEADGTSPAGDGMESAAEPRAEEIPVPPKGGRGGSAEAWAKYAASKGFEVEGTAKASEIREALEAEGIPTE